MVIKASVEYGTQNIKHSATWWMFQELSEQVRDEVDQHQRELATLQDVHSQKLATLKKQHKGELAALNQQLQELSKPRGKNTLLCIPSTNYSKQ